MKDNHSATQISKPSTIKYFGLRLKALHKITAWPDSGILPNSIDFFLFLKNNDLRRTYLNS